MTRIDWVILQRMGARMLLTAAVVFGLLCLIQSLDPWRNGYLAGIGGIPLVLVGIISEAGAWFIRSLSLVVLVGTAIGVVDLHSSRELTVIKSAGASIWKILRMPALAVLLAGFAITLFAESIVTSTNRSIEATIPGSTAGLSPAGGFWLEQFGGGHRYLMQAGHLVANGQELQDVTVFQPDSGEARVVAPSATLEDGLWLMPTATRYLSGHAPTPLVNYSLPTATTAADLRLKLGSTDDMTFFELAQSLNSRLSDPQLRNAVATRFLHLLSLPALLVGALFIAFAFTASYRRTNGYGAPIAYAIFIGFVVFVISEMADRAGSAGVLDPTLAACGPAFVAVVIGLTMLLYREDGRA